jgi:Domain of unknown function (DUF6916)
MTTPLEQLNAQVFREQLHTKFKVRTGQAELPEIVLELMEVDEQDRPGMELFALHFTGPFQPRLLQMTHRLEHETLGEFEIFLTPISADPQEGTAYESIFHRFRKKK